MALLIAGSCNKHEDLGNESTTEISALDKISISNGILVFENMAHSAEVLHQLDQNIITPDNISEIFPEFKSYRNRLLELKESKIFQEISDMTSVNNLGNMVELVKASDESVFVLEVISKIDPLGLIVNENSQIVIGENLLQVGYDNLYSLSKSEGPVDDLKPHPNVHVGKYKTVLNTYDKMGTARAQCFDYWTTNRRMTGNFATYLWGGYRFHEVSTKSWKSNLFGGWSYIDVEAIQVKPDLYFHCTNNQDYWGSLETFKRVWYDHEVQVSHAFYYGFYPSCTDIYVSDYSWTSHKLWENTCCPGGGDANCGISFN